MPELLFDRQRAALGELWNLIAERRDGEDELAASATRSTETAVARGTKKHLPGIGKSAAASRTGCSTLHDRPTQISHAPMS